MKFDYKGFERNNTKIEYLISLFKKIENSQKWIYMGLEVELDPTVDYYNENILIRWISVEEGFNDKIIVSSLLEFQILFKPKAIC